MGFRRLVVHVGLPKTATTYIQRALYANTDILAEHGVYLPRAGRLEFEPYAVAHHHLAWELFSPRRFNPSCGGWSELRRELSDVEAETVLLTSEELSRAPMKGEAEALEERLLSLSDDVTVLVVVRDQLSLLNSTYLQRVKSLTLMRAFAEYADRAQANREFDLDLWFRRWYGSDRIRLVAVPFPELVAAEPVSHLLGAAGVSVPEEHMTTPSGSINPSLGPVGVEAHHLLSRYLHGRYPGFSWRDPVGRRLHRNAGVRSRDEGWCDDDFWGWTPGTSGTAVAAASHYHDSNTRFADRVWGTKWPVPMPVDRPEASVCLEDLDPPTVERVHQFTLAMARRYERLRDEAGA